MSHVKIISQEANALRFLAYNSSCQIITYSETLSDALATEIINTVQYINSMLDIYEKSSQLSHINSAPVNVPIKITEDLYCLLDILNQVTIYSNRAFDVTMGLLSKKWNFALSAEIPESNKELIPIVSDIGPFSYTLFKDNGSCFIEKYHEAVQFDAGAAGKGYACGYINNLLQKNGIHSASIDLGGNLSLLGISPEEDSLWHVGIQRPWELKGISICKLLLHGGLSVSTSGIYDKYIFHNGKMFHHLLDSSTGMPIENNIISCTVVCSNALMADVLSTVLFAGGKSILENLIHKMNLKYFIGYVILYKNGEIEISDCLKDHFFII